MACCAAIAIVIAAARTGWAWMTGRGPVEEGFPPVATWGAGRQATASGREPVDLPPGTALGPALAVTVLGYGLLIHIVSSTGLARVKPQGDADWLLRDVVLGLVILGLLSLRRRVATASALVAVGALWFALGAIDMHVLDGLEFRTAALALDAAFHLSGWWLMLAAFAIVLVQRRPDAVPTGSAA